jgi:hypothetical protein
MHSESGVVAEWLAFALAGDSSGVLFVILTNIDIRQHSRRILVYHFLRVMEERDPNFKGLGLRLLLTVHGCRRQRSIEFELEDFEKRGFRLWPVYEELFEQLARSLSGLLYDPERDDRQCQQDAAELAHAIRSWEGVALFHHRMKLWDRVHENPASPQENRTKSNGWPRFVAAQIFVDYGPKLTKKEIDMLDRVEQGDQLEADDDWGNAILRSCSHLNQPEEIQTVAGTRSRGAYRKRCRVAWPGSSLTSVTADPAHLACKLRLWKRTQCGAR